MYPVKHCAVRAALLCLSLAASATLCLKNVWVQQVHVVFKIIREFTRL